MAEDEEAKKRMEELLELARLHNEMHDDHGPVILGERDTPPHFPDEQK